MSVNASLLCSDKIMKPISVDENLEETFFVSYEAKKKNFVTLRFLATGLAIMTLIFINLSLLKPSLTQK